MGTEPAKHANHAKGTNNGDMGKNFRAGAQRARREFVSGRMRVELEIYPAVVECMKGKGKPDAAGDFTGPGLDEAEAKKRDKVGPIEMISRK